jgi:hypothetical protein
VEGHGHALLMGAGRQSLSMSREAVPNLNQCIRVGTRPRWGGVMRFEDAAVDGRIAQILLKNSLASTTRL